MADTATTKETLNEHGTTKRQSGGYCLPYLVATVFPLAILVANPGDCPPLVIVGKTIGVILAALALLHLALRFVVRKSPARELALSAMIVHLAAYGYVDQALLGHSIPHRFLLPLWTCLFLFVLTLLWRRPEHRMVYRIASASQFALVSLVCVQLVCLGPAVVSELRSYGQQAPQVSSKGVSDELAIGELPDIYYIILDAYGRADILAELYDHDNSDFLASLESRGFYIASKSRSNYQTTRLSLPSSLNMMHLNELGPSAFRTNALRHRMVNNNEVVRVLKQSGYNTVALASIFPPTSTASFDRYLTASSLDEFQSVLLGTTWMLPLMKYARVGSSADARRARTLYEFAQLPTIGGNSSEPVFVFAHILCPHLPFVFDAEGGPVKPPRNFWEGSREVSPRPDNRAMYITSYREQLKFVNKKTLEVIDQILSDSRRPPIIILQGDHGPRAYRGDESARTTFLRERFSILNAVYVPPDLGDVGLYPTMTPVNTFRLILKRLCDVDLDLLEDKSYFAQSAYSGDFEDVTSLVDGGSKHDSD